MKRRLKLDEYSLLVDIVTRHRPDVAGAVTRELDNCSADERRAIYDAVVEELLTRGIEDGEVTKYGALVDDLIGPVLEAQWDAEEPAWLRAVRPSDANLVTGFSSESEGRESFGRVFASKTSFELTRERYVDYVRTHGGGWQVDDERDSVRLELDGRTVMIEPWRPEFERAFKALRRGDLRALRRGAGSYLEEVIDPPETATTSW